MSTAFRPHNITDIGAFTALSSAVPDYLAIDPQRCSGFLGAPLRVTEEPAPGQSGSLILPPFEDGQILTIGGDMVITSNGGSSEDDYFDAMDTLIGSLKSALNALQTAADDLAWPDGSVKVWQHGELDDEWTSYWTLAVTFSLIVDVFAT
jgi:hypothetical protein